MLALASAGALIIGLSMVFHARVRTIVSPIVLNEHEPLKVLVAFRGTPGTPAFVGFLGIATLRSQVLTVIPIDGGTPVAGPTGTREPLYQAVSTETPAEATRTIEAATGLTIHHYFYLPASDLTTILDALYYHSRGWPKNERPLTMLATLGYPYGRINPQPEVHLLADVITGLPSVNPLAASSLLGMIKASRTNLTSYQMFQLANYVRGDRLTVGRLDQYRPRVRHPHG